jgi:putative DNA primase/helicase
MAGPCCPDRAGERGRPFTAHWFVIHDRDGAIDTSATWELGGLPRTDVELAASVAGMTETAGCPMLYGEQTKRWYLWDGSGRYAPQPANYAIRMTKLLASWCRQAFDDVWQAVLGEIRDMGGQAQASVLKRARENWAPCKAFRTRIWNDAGQKAIRSQLAEQCSADADALDAGTGSIIVDNGVISYAQVIRDGHARLLPHDSRVPVTKRTGSGTRWDPLAACPLFLRFMEESVPDPDQRWWLLWRTCNALFGRMPRKGFANLIGERDSGKSTFTELIAYLAGDYARAVPVETFLAKHAGDSGFRQHELMGARFVYTHEPNQGALYDVSFMKALTGRDRQRTAGKYEKPVEWQPQCTPFLGSNSPVRFNTGDDAFMSRHEAVRFERRYAVPDPHLLDRLKAERDGILRLLVSCAEREHRLGHVPDLPLSVIAERERMAVQTEDALEFVSEWIDEGRLRESSEMPVYRCVQVTPLYRWYRAWCEDAGVRPAGRKVFSSVIGRKYAVIKSNGYRFTGLAATS